MEIEWTKLGLRKNVWSLKPYVRSESVHQKNTLSSKIINKSTFSFFHNTTHATVTHTITTTLTSQQQQESETASKQFIIQDILNQMSNFNAT